MKKNVEDFIASGVLPVSLIDECVVEKYKINVNDKTPFTKLRVVETVDKGKTKK